MPASDRGRTTPDEVVPAVAAIVLDGERTLVVRDRRREAWTLPMGRIEPGESVRDCVRREVREEAGVTVSVDRLAGVYSDPGTQVVEGSSGTVRQFVTTAVVCSVDDPDPEPTADGEETTAARFVPVGELPAMPPLDGWVRDAVTDEDPTLA